MPVLQLNETQFPLPAAPVRIGAGGGVDLALPADEGLGLQAVIDRTPQGPLVIRRAAPSALVRVNGVVLGAEPTPLMHGDKVEICGLEMRFAEDAKAGATQFVNAGDLLALAGARRAGGARATAASGGRVISLVDGKEYLVPDAGVVIGRDASCDIVVGQNEVSRRHAEIAPGEGGYVVRDVSANGVFVNGERVQGSHRLMRSDVVRIGSEEFRFYADVLPSASMAVPAEASTAPQPVAAPAPVVAEPKVFDSLPTMPSPRQPLPGLDDELSLLPEVEAQAAPTVPRAPAAPAMPPAAPAPAAVPPASPAVADARPVLATLESLNEGPAKGTKTVIRTPLAHVGRGEHNDICLPDESVSETHAKLQRRDDGWYLVDIDSTNGSYVDGSRVHGERRLEGSPDLRFGGVKMRFVTGAGSVPEVELKGTRAIAAIDRPRASVADRPRGSSSASPSSPTVPAAGAPVSAPEAKGGMPAWIWIVVALVIAAAAFFVLKGRA